MNGELADELDISTKWAREQVKWLGRRGLVSCVKSKKDEPATPKALYTSDYFQKMRAYAEQHHDDWWILSAKHGLLDPDGDPIKPYDETLSGAKKARKQEWAEMVVEQLENEGLPREGTVQIRAIEL